MSLRFVPKNPIEAHAGYNKKGKIYLDLFLRPGDDEVFPKLSSFKKYTAILDLNSNYSVRMSVTQAKELGISFKHLIPDKLLQLDPVDPNTKILSCGDLIDCIIPIMKISEPLKIYSYFEAIRRFQIIPDSENDVQGQDEVLIGPYFLQILQLTKSHKMKNIMGECGNTTLTRQTAAQDFEAWEGDKNELGLYQTLKLSGRDLLIGKLDESEKEKTDQNVDVQSGVGVQSKEIIYGSHIQDPDANESKIQMELVEAQYLLAKKIEESVESKEKVVKLIKILTQLLSFEVTALEKQAIIKDLFERGEDGLKLKNISD